MNRDGVEQIRRFYEENRRELYAYAVMLTRSPQAAEDVVHSAFSALLRQGTMPRQLKAYVYRSIRNGAYDAWRLAAREVSGSNLLKNADETDAGLTLIIQEAISALNDDEREAIVLKIYSGLTFKEIAAARGVSINTAASWYRRGLEKLKVILEEVPNG